MVDNGQAVKYVGLGFVAVLVCWMKLIDSRIIGCPKVLPLDPVVSNNLIPFRTRVLNIA